MVPINYWAVLVSGIISMILGVIWYGPLFGKAWMDMLKVTPEQIAAAKAKGMTKSYVLNFIGALVMSYVLAHAIIFGAAYTNTSGASAGMTAAFWYWLGFVAPVTLTSVLWDGKPWKYWFLTSGYYLVTLLVIGAVLGSWA